MCKTRERGEGERELFRGPYCMDRGFPSIPPFFEMYVCVCVCVCTVQKGPVGNVRPS